MCAQMALLVYVFMFSAAIKLRYSQPNQPRAYKIPGGNIGMWLVAGVGLICCTITIFIGFVPPTQIPIKNPLLFQAILVGGLLVFVMVPWLLAKKNEHVIS